MEIICQFVGIAKYCDQSGDRVSKKNIRSHSLIQGGDDKRSGYMQYVPVKYNDLT